MAGIHTSAGIAGYSAAYSGFSRASRTLIIMICGGSAIFTLAPLAQLESRQRRLLRHRITAGYADQLPFRAVGEEVNDGLLMVPEG